MHHTEEVFMSDETVELKLEARLGIDQADELLEAVRETGDATLIIDASEVNLLGAPCLQVLLAASNSRENDPERFKIVNASTVFQENIDILGVDLSKFPTMEPHQ